MACSLIKSKRITTTIAKAKALRIYVEPLITKSKSDNTHSRRVVFSYLQDKEALKELFGIVSEKVAERNGGYTRIIKLGTRLGDNAELALIELVDFNENLTSDTTSDGGATKKSRRRRGGAKKTEEVAAEEVSTKEVDDTVEGEVVTGSDESSEEKVD
jgi:large subunit ribosomal protein L17